MGGSIFGGITRTAMPAAGGVGDLHIALFTSDPVISGGSAMPVANARIEGADMRAPDVRIPYEVNGIPPRAEPYFVVAFLDDNGTVDPTDPAGAGPDRGDLVSLMGVDPPPRGPQGRRGRGRRRREAAGQVIRWALGAAGSVRVGPPSEAASTLARAPRV